MWNYSMIRTDPPQTNLYNSCSIISLNSAASMTVWACDEIPLYLNWFSVENEAPYLQHGHQLRLWDAHPVAVTAVNDVDDCVSVWVITSPVGPVKHKKVT